VVVGSGGSCQGRGSLERGGRGIGLLPPTMTHPTTTLSITRVLEECQDIHFLLLRHRKRSFPEKNGAILAKNEI